MQCDLIWKLDYVQYNLGSVPLVTILIFLVRCGPFVLKIYLYLYTGACVYCCAELQEMELKH